MNLDEAIEVYKSQRALATALGITEAAVANWRSRGRIPDLQQFRLYHISGGKVKPDANIIEGISK